MGRPIAIALDTPEGAIVRMPIKGRGSMVDVNDKGKIIRKGVKLWHVGTDTAKDLFFGRLKVLEAGPGRVQRGDCVAVVMEDYADPPAR